MSEHKATAIGLTALLVASLWLSGVPAETAPEPKEPAPTIRLSVSDEAGEAPEAQPAASGNVQWRNVTTTEWVTQQVCDGRTCRLIRVPRQVVRRVAVAAAAPYRLARVIYRDGVARTLRMLRPVGAVKTCTRSTTSAVTGEQWIGVDEQIYVKQAGGTWAPKRSDARIPDEAAIAEPLASAPHVGGSYGSTGTTVYRGYASTGTSVYASYGSTGTAVSFPGRAGRPVFTRRCGPVRRVLGWCQ